MWEQVLNGEKTLDEFVGSLTAEQMANLCTGYHETDAKGGSIVGAAAKSLAGAAGETTDRLKHLGLPAVILADGPAGIRVSRQYKVIDGEIKALDNPLAMFMDFMTQEQIKQSLSMIPQPSEKEMEAPACYQYCIAIPIGTALAQSWNPELCRKMGDIVGEEMELLGVHIWLAPAQNIFRSPLCGRNFEYYSEDPLLSGKIAGAVTSGVQAHPHCATTIKHFFCNNQETNRYVSNSILSERALREIYLKSFEVSIAECEPYTIMTSYNLVNGEHSCSSRDVLTYVLRDEWGYQGLVMTDWFVTQDIMAAKGRINLHGCASAAGCIRAGNDIVMPGSKGDEEAILAALDNEDHDYVITKADLQTTSGRVLKMILQLA